MGLICLKESVKTDCKKDKVIMRFMEDRCNRSYCSIIRFMDENDERLIGKNILRVIGQRLNLTEEQILIEI